MVFGALKFGELNTNEEPTGKKVSVPKSAILDFQ
jgi:hypothetical protein